MTLKKIDTIAELAEISEHTGERLHTDGPFPVVYVHESDTTYWADVMRIPEQRQPEDRGPLNTPPVPAPRKNGGDR